MTDFYEEDEPVDDVKAAFDSAPEHGRTAKPHDGDLRRTADGQLVEYGDGSWHPVPEPPPPPPLTEENFQALADEAERGYDPAKLRARPRPAVIDAEHLARQRAFSYRTFGPTLRVRGLLNHIRSELIEIEADPYDLSEYVDVVILALDGAWRAGHQPQQIIDAIITKQAVNEARTWPDWRTYSPDQAIEHVRDTP